MRHISFALTTEQIRNRTKTVTRRIGWKNLKPGTLLQPIVKGQGLKKGETVEKIGGPIRVVNVSRAPLKSISAQDIHREGFPQMTYREFVAQVAEIVSALKNGELKKTLAARYGVTRGAIQEISEGQNWRAVTNGETFPLTRKQRADLARGGWVNRKARGNVPPREPRELALAKKRAYETRRRTEGLTMTPAPLRKVVGESTRPDGSYARLACGHLVRVGRHVPGKQRRRCSQCRTGKEPR